MAVQFQPSFLLQQKFDKLSFQYESQVSVDSTMSSCSSTPSTPTSPIDYEIQITTAEDRDQIVEFLRTFFFKDEPLNSYLKLVTSEQPICEDIERFSLEGLENGTNLKAVYNGKLIGVCLNGVLEKDAVQKSFVSQDEKFSKIVRLLDYIGQQSDVFARYPDSDKAITVKIISVDGSYRGKGIAKELLAKTREIARELGCGFMTVDCTSHFTAMALKKLGFQLHYSLNYSDYKENGKVVFEPETPHKAATVYTQKID